MTKKIRVFITIIIVFALAFLIKSVFFKSNDLININHLPKKFMDNYFEEYSKLSEKDKEDLLIVISSKKIKKEDYGAKKVIETPNNKYYLLFDNELDRVKATKLLKDNKNVVSVEENITRELYVNDDSVEIQGDNVYNSWGVEAMGLDYASQELSKIETNDVIVAVLDTGLDVNLFNKYYSGKLYDVYNAMDASDNMFDNYGHGTHIAGTIAESTPDNVKVMPVKVSDTSAIMETDIIAGIEYITYYTDVDVINMSFGSYIDNEAEHQAIIAANQKNIICVAAAGNNNTSDLSYPAAYDETISIASIDSSLNKSDFSNYGDTVDFAAPGTDIKSILASYMEISINIEDDGDDDFATISGTSMATPHAVSSVAVLKSLNKNITIDNVRELLKENVIDLGGKGYDIYFGNGLINFKEAVFCTNNQMNCDDYNIFKVIKPTEMSINEVTFTDYNYGSITNILNTKVSFKEVDGLDYTKELNELDDLTITGYDPYSSSNQTVTIHYLDLEASFKVKNPDNYESGWEYELKNNKYYISGYKNNTNKITKIYFPKKIDNNSINGILSNSGTSIFFSNLDNVKYIDEIILPSNIEEVGSYAFKGLPSCTKVVSEASDLIVNGYSFAEMPYLTIFEGNIIFSDTSSHVFYNDLSLKNVTISENTSEKIPIDAFYGCKSLNSINIPNVITEIDAYSFYECSLTNIDLSNNLKKIGVAAFYNNRLESVSFPESLEEINATSFNNNNLKSIYIPKNVSKIEDNVFFNNHSLETIRVSEDNQYYDSRNNSNLIIETATNKVITGSINSNVPNSVRIIGQWSFAGLNIEELELPEGVTTIEKNAFDGSGLLEKVILPNSITNIDDTVFSYYDNIDEDKMLGAATSGFNTNIGTTVMWLHENSYSHQFALNQKRTYIVIEDSSEVVDFISGEVSLKKTTFFADENLRDNIKSVKYIYSLGEEEIEEEVEDYDIEYQNGDSLTINDYAFYVRFDLDHSYKNIRIPVFINVIKEADSIELPDIGIIKGEGIYSYQFPNGIFTPYDGMNFNEAGDYTLVGDYIENKTGKVYYSVSVNIHVYDKELVFDYAEHIYAKKYDGTTNVDSQNIVLSSYNSNLKASDYTIVSAKLDSPEVNDHALVKIKAKINDASFDKFAFSGNKQELEFTGYMSVIDLNIPTVELLKGQMFIQVCDEVGCYSGYGNNSFEEAGDYVVGGHYMKNDGSYMINDILIPIHIIDKNYVSDWAEVSPKKYDGTANIDKSTIVLPGVDKSNYTVVDAELITVEVTEYGLAKTTIRLSDDFYSNNAFPGNLQECEMFIPISVIKGTPEFDIPNNITAEVGQNLYDIELPEGFTWTSENIALNEKGNKEFYAKYTPEDTNNYEVVENIKITIKVLGKVIPFISSDYENFYDNSNHTIQINVEIPNYSIKYSIDNNDYNLTEAPTFKEVGSYTVNYIISADGYDDIEGSNNVKIYGIKSIDSSIITKDNSLIITDNSFNTISGLITTYSTSTEFRHLNNKDEILNDNDTIKTGDSISIVINDSKTYTYKIAYLGDASGDGKINYLDYVKVYNHIQKVKHPELDKEILENEYYLAADMNCDNKINYLDYVGIYNKIKELKGGSH